MTARRASAVQLLRTEEASPTGETTGGVSYIVGGAAAEPTLCFATPTSVRFSGFMDLKL